MPTTTRLISIVDDDYSVRRALGRLVQFAGFSAETFGSAEDFLRSAELGLTDDVEGYCAEYERMIARAGGIDLQVLGIGTVALVYAIAQKKQATDARASTVPARGVPPR